MGNQAPKWKEKDSLQLELYTLQWVLFRYGQASRGIYIALTYQQYFLQAYLYPKLKITAPTNIQKRIASTMLFEQTIYKMMSTVLKCQNKSYLMVIAVVGVIKVRIYFDNKYKNLTSPQNYLKTCQISILLSMLLYEKRCSYLPVLQANEVWAYIIICITNIMGKTTLAPYFASLIVIFIVSPVILSAPVIRPIAKSGVQPKSSEDNYREMVIAKTEMRIQKYNALYGEYFTSAHNQFSAYTEDQLKEILVGGVMSEKGSMFKRHVESATDQQKSNLRQDIEAKPNFLNGVVPKVFSVDYTLNKNPRLVTTVKNQGSCGSCWAFCSIAEIESYFLFKYKLYLDLSQQQMVDCVPAVHEGNDGCGGGYLDSVNYYATLFPIAQQKYYKYTAKEGACDQKKINQGKTFKINSYVYIYDCITLLNSLLNVRPLGVAGGIGKVWYSYSSGVLLNCNETPIGGHAFLMVGANSDGTTNVLTNWYKFKNSWGTGWGEKGYIRIYKDPKDNTSGPCNVCKGGIYSL